MKIFSVVFSMLGVVFSALAVTNFAKAEADFGGLKDVTKATFTNKFKVEQSSYCGHNFNYLQLTAIPGQGAVWVPVEFLYPPGSADVVLVEDCERGNQIYGVGSCGC